MNRADKIKFKNHSDMKKELDIVEDIPEADLVFQYNISIINPTRGQDIEESRRLGINRSRTANGSFRKNKK